MKIRQGRLARELGELAIALRPSFLPAKPGSGQAMATPAEQAGPYKRLLSFPARALTDAALTAEQAHRAARLAELGRLYSPGIVDGLEATLTPTPRTQTSAEPRQGLQIEIRPGLGICRSGEEISLAAPLRIPDIYALPVVVDSLRHAKLKLPPNPDDSSKNLAQAGRSYQACYVSTLSALIAADNAHVPEPSEAYFPMWFVLLLQPIEVQKDCSQNPADRAEQDPQLDAFRDIVRIEGARPILFHYDEAHLFGDGPPSRNPGERASWIWTAECVRNHSEADSTLEKIWPWEHIGLPIGLICLSDDDLKRSSPIMLPDLPKMPWPQVLPAGVGEPKRSYLLRSAVVRMGGKAHEPSPLPAEQLRAQKSPGNVGAHLASPALGRALLEGLTEQLAQAPGAERITVALPAQQLTYVELPASGQATTWYIQLIEQDLSVLPLPNATLATVPGSAGAKKSVEETLKNWTVELPLLSGTWAVQVEVPAGVQRGIWLLHTDGHRTHLATVFQSVNVGASLCALPAAGLLPSWAIDVAGTQTLPQGAVRSRSRTLRNCFFPTDFDIDVLPVREDELAAIIERSVPLAPYDLMRVGQPDAVRVLVPVPADRFDAELLQMATVSPAFAEGQLALLKQQAELVTQYAQQHGRHARLHTALTGQRVIESALPEESVAAVAVAVGTADLTEVGRPGRGSPAWSPDSSRVALHDGGRSLLILSANDGSVLARGQLPANAAAGAVRTVAFSRNGDIVLTHNNTDISIWDAQSAKQKAFLDKRKPSELNDTITNIVYSCLSQDGSRVLCHNEFTKKLAIWDWQKGNDADGIRTISDIEKLLLATMPTDDLVVCIEPKQITVWKIAELPTKIFKETALVPLSGARMSPDNSELAVWADKTVNIYSIVTATGALAARQQITLPASVRDVAISPSDRSAWIATDVGLYRCLPTTTDPVPLSFPAQERLAITCVQLAAEGHMAVVSYERRSPTGVVAEAGVRLWSTDPPQILASMQGVSGRPELSPDGVSLIVNSQYGGLRLLDIQTDLTEVTKILRNSVLSQEQQCLIDDLGIEPFVKLLEEIVSEANVQIDLGFLSVQTDIFRLRQHMLQSTAANLSSSPVIAQIAETQSSLTASEELGQYYKSLLGKMDK